MGKINLPESEDFKRALKEKQQEYSLRSQGLRMQIKKTKYPHPDLSKHLIAELTGTEMKFSLIRELFGVGEVDTERFFQRASEYAAMRDSRASLSEEEKRGIYENACRVIDYYCTIQSTQRPPKGSSSSFSVFAE